MTPYSAIIRQFLISQGLGAASGTWPIFVSFMPEDPNSAIAVYDTSGKLDGRMMRTGEQIEKPGIQVRVRGQSYPEVFNKANAIALALDQDSKGVLVVISGTESYTIQNVSRSGAIIPVGMEEEGDRRRYNFTINAMLTVRKEQ